MVEPNGELKQADPPQPEGQGLLGKWLNLLRLTWVHRGLRYAVLWTADLILRLTGGASPLRFSRITDQLYVGGQFLRRGWSMLEQRGITAVVNMRKEFDDLPAGITPGRYLYLPTVDNKAPTIDHLKRGVEFIKRELERGGRVYIHCEAGVGRAPTMAAAYLISEGWSQRAAWDLLRSRRPFIRPTSPQVEQLNRFARLVGD